MGTVIKYGNCTEQADCSDRFTDGKVGPKEGPGSKLTSEESWQEMVLEIDTRLGSEHFVARQNSKGLFYSEIGTISPFIIDKSVEVTFKILLSLKIGIHELLIVVNLYIWVF